MKKLSYLVVAVVLIAIGTIAACSRTVGSAQGRLLTLAESRNLSPEDAAHALKTFVPPGGRDEYLLFASGGHSGQVHVIGVPSMRLLKTIAVFTPEPWQGYGYGADWSEQALNGDENPGHGPHVAPANAPKEPLRWGDAHHPALSETGGKYDGRWLYINDRAHGRIGMVDLSDFRTKQILQVPNLQTSHGGIFATPDTQYVHISSKVPSVSREGLEHRRGLYKAHCVACHGESGHGDGPAAGAMKPGPRDHTDRAYMSTLSSDEIGRVIQMGGAIKGKPLMPSHPQLRGADLEALVGYVRSLSAAN